MLRKFVCALFACVVFVGFAMADEVKGKIKSVDPDKKTITVTVGDKDQTFSVSDDTKIVNAAGKDLKGGITAKQLKADASVTVTCDNGKASQIQIAGGKKANK